MNLKLKLLIQKYLEDGEEIILSVNQENLDKFKVYGNFCNYTLNDETGMLEFSIRDFFEYDIYHYFDLIDGINHVVFNPEAYLKPMDNDVKYDFLEKWEYGKDKKRVVITHANCTDGSGTSAVIKYHSDIILENENNIWEDIEYIFLDYNSFNIDDLAEKLKDCLVYVGDFSFDKEQLEILENVVEALVIIDHHKGAYDSEISNNKNVHVDLTKSGALLTYEFFFGVDKIPPYVIALISDRDLWNFFYGVEAKALQLLLKKEGHEQIMEYMSDDEEISIVRLKDDLSEYIEEVEELEKKHLEKAKKFAKPYTLNNIVLYGLNLTSSVSDILNHVSKFFNAPSFAYWEDENGLFQLSFRNSDDSEHVDKLAKIIGGNGHIMASGSKVSFENLCLEEFFINKRIVIKYKIEDEVTNKFFEHYGINRDWVKNTLHCEAIQTILNKDFHDLFITKRDKDQNIILKLKEGN